MEDLSALTEFYVTRLVQRSSVEYNTKLALFAKCLSITPVFVSLNGSNYR